MTPKLVEILDMYSQWKPQSLKWISNSDGKIEIFYEKGKSWNIKWKYLDQNYCEWNRWFQMIELISGLKIIDHCHYYWHRNGLNKMVDSFDNISVNYFD